MELFFSSDVITNAYCTRSHQPGNDFTSTVPACTYYEAHTTSYMMYVCYFFISELLVVTLQFVENVGLNCMQETNYLKLIRSKHEVITAIMLFHNQDILICILYHLPYKNKKK